jgi:hypothetical protein
MARLTNLHNVMLRVQSPTGWTTSELERLAEDYLARLVAEPTALGPVISVDLVGRALEAEFTVEGSGSDADRAARAVSDRLVRRPLALSALQTQPA